MEHQHLPELPEEEEEVLGEPTFEVLVRDGEPIAAGTYFMAPPLYMRKVKWDPEQPDRLLVVASDGSHWHAESVPQKGRVNVLLRPLT